MLKQIVTGGLMIALTLSIAGCSSKLLTEGQAHDPASSDAIAADSSESTPTWTPPTDGRWPHKASGHLLGLGDEFIMSSVYGPMYTGAVVGLPEFTDIAGGKVTMSQEATFTRLEKAWGEPSITDVYLVFGYDEFREGYDNSVRGSLECGEGITAIGESVTCTMTGRTSVTEIENSSWVIGNYASSRVAAWPGQETRP
ncbi:MAG TPA: hypothetical protein PKV54_08250 [Microbacteriaceae bacterium]|nr:hypothetical protein [Actinomycetota bacterium]HRA09511.1 hypothetical protein [Microbacteriaceae bacterium]